MTQVKSVTDNISRLHEQLKKTKRDYPSAFATRMSQVRVNKKLKVSYCRVES